MAAFGDGSRALIAVELSGAVSAEAGRTILAADERIALVAVDSEPAPVASPLPDVLVVAAGGQGPPGRAGPPGEGIPGPPGPDTAEVIEDQIYAAEPHPAYDDMQTRSEERSVGKGCVSTCESRWWRYNRKKQDNIKINYTRIPKQTSRK